MAYEDGFYIERDPKRGWLVLSPLGVEVGARFNFYQGETKVPLEVSRNPYPKELNQDLASPHRKLKKAEAEDVLARLILHIKTVKEKIPRSKRIGGSQFW